MAIKIRIQEKPGESRRNYEVDGDHAYRQEAVPTLAQFSSVVEKFTDIYTGVRDSVNDYNRRRSRF